ncbi:MAG: BrnT family toxin [Rhodoferax sp.]|uniref:BrnT family toxin n=1 Tax=Rhodoferax sp. TaxID=50421 RepID=UPI0026341184|nr:BrnT family toxin [Rhodoferax sp.]MDD5336401.1 BrnT family toxin [Rhodoferax sp.]
MNYSFDPRKLAINVQRHGVWFAEAEAFDWETVQLQLDGRKHYSEPRFIATGLIEQRLHVMVFCLREVSVRIISLRKANDREVKRYVNNA